MAHHTTTTGDETLLPTGVHDFPDPRQWRWPAIGLVILLLALLAAGPLIALVAAPVPALAISGLFLVGFLVASRATPRSIWLSGCIGAGLHIILVAVGQASGELAAPVLVGMGSSGVLAIGAMLMLQRRVAIGASNFALLGRSGVLLGWLLLAIFVISAGLGMRLYWADLMGTAMLITVGIGSIYACLHAAILGFKLANMPPLFAASTRSLRPDGSEPKPLSRGSRILTLAFGVPVPVAVGLVAWLWFAPVDDKAAEWDAMRAAYQRELPPAEANGWFDLVAVNNAISDDVRDRANSQWLGFTDDPMGFQPNDPDLQDLIALHKPALDAWQRLHDKQVAVFVPDPEKPLADPGVGRLTAAIRLRLLAQLDSPTRFAMVLADASRVIRTLTGPTDILCVSAASRIAESVTLAVCGHLARQHSKLDDDALRTIDRTLAAAIDGYGNPEGAVVLDLLKPENYVGDSPLLMALDDRWHLSRVRRLLLAPTQVVHQAREVDDAAYRDFINQHPEKPGDDLDAIESWRFSGPSPVSAFDVMPVWKPFSADARYSRTALKMLRVAVRLVVHYKRLGRLPESLEQLATDGEWSAAGLLTDMWSDGGQRTFIYERGVEDPAVTWPRFLLASRGLKASADIGQIATDAPNLILTVPPPASKKPAAE